MLKRIATMAGIGAFLLLAACNEPATPPPDAPPVQADDLAPPPADTPDGAAIQDPVDDAPDAPATTP